MPYRPLVSKIRVHNPNKKGSSVANRNYVTYIATREGVSLEQVNDINDVLNVDDMVEKELNETIVHKEAENEQYLRYIAKRPRSQGLFGNVDTDDLKEISSQVAKLTDSGRVIYRGVISLSEKDGEALGFRDVNAWNNYLKQVMPEIAQQLGISSTDNTWIAAFHAEETHPHVHYMLWDNSDRVKNPYIHKATQQKIRIYLEQEMFDNEYEKAIRQVYEEELTNLKEKRNLERSNMLQKTADIISDVSYVPGVAYERLPQRVPKEYLQNLSKEVEKLITLLPESGRLNYKFLPPDAKEQLEKITHTLFERPDMQNSLNKYLQSVEQMHKAYGETKTKIASELERAERDIWKRVSNKILKELKPVLLNDESMSEERNSVPSMEEPEEAERNSVPSAEEPEESERNSVPFTVESGEVELSSKYVIQWSGTYKDAMKLLYEKEPDIKGAFELLKKEADHGNALAIHKAASLIERELLDISPDEAVGYYNESYKAFSNIYHYPNGKNDWEREYNQRYAAYRIGKLYEQGKGNLETDYEKARVWYQRAGNYKYAEYSLAKLYLDEKVYASDRKDLNENQKEAFDLLMDSASQSKPNPYAVYELGDMYLTGKGIPEDQQEGEKYIKQAADIGNENAKVRLAFLYYEKPDIEMKKKAVEMLAEMSGKGKAMAQYKLGTIYCDLESGFFDLKLGLQNYELAAAQENSLAQYKLGCIYTNAENPEHYDPNKGMKYLEQSAEQGNQYAQYKLGCFYSDRMSSQYNIDKALRYFTLAAEQGNQYAQCRLGCIFYFGKDVLKDQDLGKYWLERSSEQGNEFAKSVLDGPVIGTNFSYCLLKGALSAMENMNRQAAYQNREHMIRSQSKQVAKERYLHHDNEQ